LGSEDCKGRIGRGKGKRRIEEKRNGKEWERIVDEYK